MRLHLLTTVMVFVAGCGVDSSPEQGRLLSAIQEGTEQPPEAYALSVPEQNAVLAQAVVVAGKNYQGCSATLVGDRVVVTASHCLVTNQQKWLDEGAAPELGSVTSLRYFVGADIDAPSCVLRVKSVAIHPDAKLDKSPLSTFFAQAIDHDIGVAILAESTLETCKDVMPIGLAERLGKADIVDKKLLIAGFGSTDGTYDFSPKRLWGQLQGVELEEQLVVLANIKEGRVSFGDSGSGLLARRGDGRLYTHGVSSVGVGGYTGYQRVDNNLAFVDSIATKRDFCGAAAEHGVCMGDRAVNCSAAGRPIVDDCAEQQKTCAETGDMAVCRGAAAGTSGTGDAGVGADADLAGQSGDDGGCMIAGATKAGGGWPWAVVLLGLGVLLGWRRR